MNAQGQEGQSTTGETDCRSEDCWKDPRVAQWARVKFLQEALWQAQFRRSHAALEAIHADHVMADVIDGYNELYRDGRQARRDAWSLANYEVKDVGDDEAASCLYSWADATMVMLHEGLESKLYYRACHRQYNAHVSLEGWKSICKLLKSALRLALSAAQAG